MKTNPKIDISDHKTLQIIAAARTVLARQGFAGTTISLVAGEAGVSRGLLHYYFKNKEELLARVIQENMATSISKIKEILVASDSTQDFAHKLVEALRTTFKTDPDFFNLFFEAYAVARYSSAMEVELQALYGQFRQAIKAGLEDATERSALSPTLPLNSLAVVLTSLIDGLGLQLITDTALFDDEELWSTTVRTIELLLGAT